MNRKLGKTESSILFPSLLSFLYLTFLLASSFMRLSIYIVIRCFKQPCVYQTKGKQSHSPIFLLRFWLTKLHSNLLYSFDQQNIWKSCAIHKIASKPRFMLFLRLSSGFKILQKITYNTHKCIK